MNYYEKTIKEERKYTGNIINVDKVTVVLPTAGRAQGMLYVIRVPLLYCPLRMMVK